MRIRGTHMRDGSIRHLEIQSNDTILFDNTLLDEGGLRVFAVIFHLRVYQPSLILNESVRIRSSQPKETNMS